MMARVLERRDLCAAAVCSCSRWRLNLRDHNWLLRSAAQPSMHTAGISAQARPHHQEVRDLPMMARVPRRRLKGRRRS